MLSEIYENYQADAAFSKLRDSGSRFVPGVGQGNRIIIIGGSPGKVENARRTPFVGPAGKIMREKLKELDFDLGDVFFTNVIKYWPKDANNTQLELYSIDSQKYLLDELRYLKPLYVGLVGRLAIQTFYPTISSIKEVNGALLNNMFVPLHQAAVVLHNPKMEEDFTTGLAKLHSYAY